MSNINRRHGQRGYTIWTILVFLGVAAFIGSIAVAVAPSYINNSTINSVIQEMGSNPEVNRMTNRDIRNLLERRFDVNQVTALQAICRRKDEPCVKIERTASTLRIIGNYEHRVAVMGNVDAVVMFNENIVEVPLPSDD